ncbi:site-specific DNA-methyltransferase [Claveliimonas bilis]|uniref:site-specific DNA-methyltransferase n=1 Tax=Claveliimonas bilis TaxID=3028070 RepID=UPI001E57ADD2|nr:site-specific DNA-methyltransferase [Claveliimonas bilis]BCZ27939.1 site-specific DNA-methyltransferase [Claveliimonas bilis]
MENGEQLIFEFEQRPTIKGFPELRWTGKRPYRSTQYYPAQLRETYGQEQNGWMNKIFWGDNLQVMSHLLKEYRGKIDLIYIDPPFDSKADYKKKIEIRGVGKAESDSSSFEEKQYGDIWTNDEYLQFMYERLVLMRELLSDSGSIFLHCDWHKSAHLRLLMGEVFGEKNFVNEIIWGYKDVGGGRNNNFYKRKHDTIFWFSKTSSYKVGQIARAPLSQSTLERFGSMFDEKGVITYRKFKEMRPAEFETRKKQGRVPDDLDMVFLSKDFGRQMEDYWIDINPLRTRAEKDNPEEVLEYPTQKPNALLKRIIKSATEEGDLVFDCFMGSGTTQAVAMKLGRRFIGADINLGAIQTTTKRLLSIAAELKPAHKPVNYGMIQPQLSMIAEEPTPYLAAVSVGVDTELSSEDCSKGIDFFKLKGLDTSTREEDVKYPGFEVYNVNNYDFFRNPVEARDLLIAALEIQPFPQSGVWDGELDGRMVKIMPVNRIATKADLKELLANLPYKIYEKRKEENPNQPVERITIVCMGHEPDLKGALEQELSDYKIDAQIVDILRDKKELQLKRDSEAEIVREGGKLIIRAFYPMNLMQKLSLQKEYVEDWRQLVDSIMIDWNFDGVVMQPTVTDVPGKNEMVKGIYDIPEGCGTIKVKITDLLSESLEVEVR